MQHRLAAELADMIALPKAIVESGSERSVPIAAVTVAAARSIAISATRVLGRLGSANPAAFEAHVAQLAAECALDAHVCLAGGGLPVRLSGPAYTIWPRVIRRSMATRKQ